jgi:hypothetical protein
MSVQSTADTDERNPTAVMAVPPPALYEKLKRSVGSTGSIAPAWMLEIESVREDFEESGTATKRSAGKPATPATRQGDVAGTVASIAVANPLEARTANPAEQYWLERAGFESRNSAGAVTANSVDRTLPALTAVARRRFCGKSRPQTVRPSR